MKTTKQDFPVRLHNTIGNFKVNLKKSTEQLLVVTAVISAMFFNRNKRETLQMNRTQALVSDTNMPAVSFLGCMAAMTS